MNKGHVFFAQNSDVDYVTQAYALALTIKKHNKQYNSTCIITSDNIPDEYRHAFDYIVKIPGNDNAKNSQWKIENRWKIIHATPFQENIVYDTDMLMLSSNDHWWDFLSKREVAITSKVRDYKNRTITNDFYRKVFTANALPNTYMGVHYFKKSPKAYEFYSWLQIITENYNVFYDKFLTKSKQRFCSMDVNAALAVKFMGCESEFLLDNDVLSFVHMKPAIQGWHNLPKSWQDVVRVDYNGHLTVGNFTQSGIFHYTEDSFLTKDFLKKLHDN
jgi:hypothetical protein